MKSEFSLLFEKLIEHKPINVSISQELDIWNDADDKQNKAINDFFSEFIFGYGIFHELLDKSDAIGNYHELKLSITDRNILMEGKTYIIGEWEEEEEEEVEPEEKCFKWIFDKKGNIMLIE